MNILKKIFKYLISPLFILFTVYSIMRPTLINYDLKKNARYTITYTEYITYSRSGKTFTYIYYVKNNRYIGSYFYKDGLIIPGGRYYVSFSSKHPNWSKFIFKKVSGNIKSAPPEGWDKIPE
jgi:hypothetical protein